MTGTASRLVAAWYAPRPTVVSTLLRPAAALFGAAVALRREMFRRGWRDSERLPVPVVVVGNVTVGGAGKTPLALALADALAARGRRPGFVSRGYGGGDEGPRAVIPTDDPHVVGDEPLLLAASGHPVWIAHRRVAAARGLVEANPQVDVIIADDGLQHYALARDVELAVIDADRLFGNGLPLPAGPLREPKSRLREVDAIVVNGGGNLDLGAPRQFEMKLGRERFASVSGNAEMTAEEFVMRSRGQRVVAIAGIGNPGRFFEHLAALGVAARGRAFPDHHAFQPAELRMPDADVIVMTEKDAVKCGAFADARMWFMRVEAILPSDFDEFLLSRIKARADGRQAA